MGLLDDAIREHLELKRKHGANPDDVARQEQEALGPGQRNEFAQPEATAPAPEAEPEPPAAPPAEAPAVEEPPAAVEAGPVDELPRDEPDIAEEPPAAGAPTASPGGSSPDSPRDEDPWLDDEPDEVPADEALEARPKRAGGEEEDVLEETPDFLSETPEHDRLWFEQKPPRDFDWDK
jgi:hypothetical protein